jgi:cell division septation protein DedD
LIWRGLSADDPRTPRNLALLRAALAIVVALLLLVLALLFDTQLAPSGGRSGPVQPVAGLQPVPAPPQPVVPAEVEPRAQDSAQAPEAPAVASITVPAVAAQQAPGGRATLGADFEDQPGEGALKDVAPVAVPDGAVVLPPAAIGSATDGYRIQLGVFGDPANAVESFEALTARGLKAHIQSRVVLGPYPDRAAAERAQAALRKAGAEPGILVPPRKKP